MSAANSFAEYYAAIQDMLANAKKDEQLFEAISNAPFHNKLHSTSLDLGMIVFVLVNKSTGTIDRISYSKTPPAIDAVRASSRKFEDIKIPMNNKGNITVKAIKSKKFYKTSDWGNLLTPALTAEAARFNQAEAGMGCSYVYPLNGARDGGALIFSFYQPTDLINTFHHTFMKQYSDYSATRLGPAK